MKILIVEDEEGLRESMGASLVKEQYLVEYAADFGAALDKINEFEYDCLLLDIGLPGGSGLSLLAELKKARKNEAVIIISAKDSVDDRINGLDLGADDYLPKPFHLAELTARVKSVLRRKKQDGNPILLCNNISIDSESRMVWIDGQELILNRKEFDVLFFLITNKNRLVNKTALAEQVWGDYIDETNSFDFIYSQIKNLRKKLKEYNANIEVQAIYGVGYKLITQ